MFLRQRESRIHVLKCGGHVVVDEVAEIQDSIGLDVCVGARSARRFQSRCGFGVLYG